MKSTKNKPLGDGLHRSPEQGTTAVFVLSPKDTLPDVEITLEEVKNVICEFDIKETGDIDFEEFLFAVTHPRNYIKLIHGKCTRGCCTF